MKTDVDLQNLGAGARGALRTAVRHLNAPLPQPVDEASALRWLRDRSWTPEERTHARALLDETDPAILLDLVLGGAVRYVDLAECADLLLPVTHPTRIWLADRRHV